MSEAALFRTAEALRPTFLLDEAHYWLGAGRTGERVEAIRQLLCGGYRQDDPPVRRLEKTGDGFKEVEFSVYCPKVVALIGQVDDQLADRALIVRLERKAPTDRVERFLVRRVKAAAEPVRQAILAWVRAYRDAVREAYEAVEPIKGIDDREADKFAVLQAVLQVLDPSRLPELIAYARQNAGVADKQDLDAQLLAAIRRAFDEAGKTRPDDFLATTALLQALAEDFAWAAVRQDDHAGVVRASRTLSNILARYGVRSQKAWAEGKTIRGYCRRDLEGVWRKYTQYTPVETPETPDSPGFSTDADPHMASQPPLASPGNFDLPGDPPGPGDSIRHGHARPDGHARRGSATEADPGESGVSGVSTGGITQTLWQAPLIPDPPDPPDGPKIEPTQLNCQRPVDGVGEPGKGSGPSEGQGPPENRPVGGAAQDAFRPESYGPVLNPYPIECAGCGKPISVMMAVRSGDDPQGRVWHINCAPVLLTKEGEPPPLVNPRPVNPCEPVNL